MKHLVFVALTLSRGGAEGVIARLCNEYFCKHYRVSIITCKYAAVEYDMEPSISVECIEETKVQYANMGRRFLKRRTLLRDKFKLLQPDLVISFLPEPNFLALSVKNMVNCPVLISIRNDPKREYHNPIYQMLMRYFYPKADGYILQTPDAKSYFSFSKHIEQHATIIFNPLDRKYMNLQPTENRRKCIVNVGRLDSQKNQKMLIEAFAEITKSYPEYTLEIYGSGKLKTTLEQMIQDLKLAGKVNLCGNVPNLLERIKDAELFVLCSDYEGMPNSLMEALAMGIPTLATDCPCGGPRCLIQNGENGLLIPVGDKDKLIENVNRILGDKELAMKMAQKAVVSMETCYPEIIYQQWDEYVSQYLKEDFICVE